MLRPKSTSVIMVLKSANRKHQNGSSTSLTPAHFITATKLKIALFAGMCDIQTTQYFPLNLPCSSDKFYAFSIDINVNRIYISEIFWGRLQVTAVDKKKGMNTQSISLSELQNPNLGGFFEILKSAIAPPIVKRQNNKKKQRPYEPESAINHELLKI